MSLSSVMPKEVLQMALDSIRANKFRSFLTILGITVGVITAIVVASILTGMRQSIASTVEDYGTNNIFAFHLSSGLSAAGSDRSERSRKSLVVADADAILAQSNAVKDIALVAPGIGNFDAKSFDDTLIYEGKVYKRGSTDGVSANYDVISNLAVREGRFITESDDWQRRNVIVIGVDCADALFPDQSSGIAGKVVKMNGALWEIIGVLEKRNAGLFGENAEDSKIFLPFRTARKVAPQREFLKLIIQAKPNQLSDALLDTREILRKRRGVTFGQPDNFDLTTAGEMIQKFDSITAMVGLIAIGISSLGLLVGGIGVMNIMLVSVTERTKEIGIRKAVGATRKAIILQFLLEAMTLTFFGGLIGVILAIGIAQLIIIFVPSLPAAIPLWAVITGLTVSIGVGLIFGVLPARKAAKLDPIECLRYE